ncbi:branched-chain amino acid ABC transporter permease [Natroniella sp. ANB-PHB2]|uniref:branched-chain amino acid ABC transporter permease n=1 Tax=Natroniella sp. ANB-PHB2 TaxID=3384444 RepID=UPI0038D46F95
MLQMILSGIATGSLYALGAFGLVLIFKTTHVVNFAQGDMAMLSTFVAFSAMTSYGFSYFTAFIVALIFAAILGVVVERVFMRPAQGSGHLTLLIITVGLLLIMDGIAGWIWGYSPNSFPRAFTGDSVNILGAGLAPHSIFIICLVLVIMVGMFLFFKKSMAGIAMRATAEDITTARLMGINVNKVFLLTWGVSSVLGAIAGILIAPVTYLFIGYMMDIQIKAFSAAVLGGFTSLPGAVLGGILLGVMENFVGVYISTGLGSTIAFLLIIIMLWFKPTGLLGKKTRKKV